MIFIVIDRCRECGDKTERNNLIAGICEQCWQEYLYPLEVVDIVQYNWSDDTYAAFEKDILRMVAEVTGIRTELLEN